MKKFTFLLAAALFCGGMSVMAQDDEEEISITPAQDATGNPVFKFNSASKYYIIELDDKTKAAHLNESQYEYIGPDKEDGRNLFVWQGQGGQNTINFRATKGEKNSFGVPDAFKACVAGACGWTGLGYNVGKSHPIDLSGIDDDYVFHISVKSSSKQPVDFYLVDGKKREAHLVFGDKNYDKHEVIDNFPRDNKWYNIDIPMTYLEDYFGLSFKNDKAYEDNNLLCVLMGTTLGQILDYDAAFFYNPHNISTGIHEVETTGNTQSQAVVYTLDGKRVTLQYAEANKGIYVVKQGDKTKKVIF